MSFSKHLYPVCYEGSKISYKIMVVCNISSLFISSRNNDFVDVVVIQLARHQNQLHHLYLQRTHASTLASTRDVCTRLVS